MRNIILLSDIVENCQTNHLEGNFVWPRYLGPYVIKSSIRQHVKDTNVLVIDYFTKSKIDYLSQFLSDKTDYIGISVTFLHNRINKKRSDFNLWANNQEEISNWFNNIKKLAPNAKIILGGSTADVFYKKYLLQNKQMPYSFEKNVNYVFCGYSEETIVKFLQFQNTSLNIEEKQNIKFILEKKRAGQGAVCIQNIWEASDCIQKNEWLPFEISKGCRFNCKFCFYDHSGSSIKSPELIKKELLENYYAHGTTGYFFTDDTINDSPEKINMLYNIIKSLPFKLEWISYARPDIFYVYPDTYKKMLDMGCKGVFLGIETLNENAGKIAGKGLNPEKIKETLYHMRELANQYDSFITASFILGLVGETEESLNHTLKWLKNQNVLDYIQYEILYVSDDQDFHSNDFSKKPEKFGFKKISWSPYYWEHQTLNYNKCLEIANQWETELRDHIFSAVGSHINSSAGFWSYPRIRTLGYSHLESIKILKNKNFTELNIQNQNWINQYHKELSHVFQSNS